MTAQSRGHWFVGMALAWLCGVALQLQEPALHGAVTYSAAVCVGGLGLALRGASRRTLAIALIGLLGMAMLGFGASGARAVLRAAQLLPASLEGQDIVVDGVVASLPQQGAAGTRFRFEVETALRQGESITLPPLLALGWYRGQHEDAAATQPRAELRAGQRWRFTLRLRQPHGSVNPHGFDYELYL
ncbi:MAG: DUF4131 domain-containing protein, partial [Burkholderiales bacterium]|nr:DUF4131 domain-containing protein [Burkholderiales bacterium]